MENKDRTIWKNLGWALAATPMVALIGLIFITLIGALDDAVTKIQLAGYWWIIPIVSYLLSLTYFLYEPTIRINRKRNEAVNCLMLYLKEQLQKQQVYYPKIYKDFLNQEKLIKEVLLNRIKIWAWEDPKIWKQHFPTEKFTKSLFGIVDNLIEDYKKTEKRKQ